MNKDRERELEKIYKKIGKKKWISDIIALIIMLIAIWYMCRDLYHDGEFDFIIDFLK